MIRTLILVGAFALGLGAVAQADGVAPGFGGPRLHRAVHHRHRHHVRRHRPVHAYARHGVAPGGLTQSLNAPLYNVPPRRFP